MQPALSAYNMAEKIAEANRSLALQQAREAAAEDAQRQATERARKVTFKDVLVDYGPVDSLSGL